MLDPIDPQPNDPLNNSNDFHTPLPFRALLAAVVLFFVLVLGGIIATLTGKPAPGYSPLQENSAAPTK